MKKILLGLSCLFTLEATALLSFKSASEIIEQKIKFVECAFTDINGKLKSVTIPVSRLKSAIKDGLKFDGSSVPGCSIITDSDMHLSLDLDSCILLPKNLRKHKTAMIMCDMGLSETRAYDGSPRCLLKKVSKELERHNLLLNVGSELEFYIIKGKENTADKASVIDSEGYFDASIDSLLESLKLEILDALFYAGIPVEKIHHEVGPGQYEVTFEYGNAVKSADVIIFTKYIVQSVVAKYNMHATFMPKPVEGENGNGMHIHYSLYDTNLKKNIFYDGKSEVNLSKKAQMFLGGNLKYMLEIAALLNPTINSYKRLIPGFEAPVYMCWGLKNRSALIRIPMVNASESNAVRAELRCPDPSCNPYLAFAAITATGTRGLSNNIAAPQPVSGNLYKLTSDQIKNIGIFSLPSSLEEALVHLNKSQFIEEFMGKRMLSEFNKVKAAEVNDFYNRNHPKFNKNYVTAWEVNKYL